MPPWSPTYFTETGQPTLHPEGYHKRTIRYDDRERPVGIAFFGADGKPGVNKEGWHRWACKYDGRGNRVEEAYFGGDVRPALSGKGFARLVTVFNDRNELIDLKAFDERGKPVPLEVYGAAVTPGSQAERFGIQVGDVLVTYDGVKVANSARLIQRRPGERAGDAPRKLEILRGGRRLTFSVSPGQLGVTLDDRAARRSTAGPP